MWRVVKEFCEECKVDIPYTVKFVEFDHKDILGHADSDNKIVYIGLSAFRKGKIEVFLTLLEEILHIESGESDHSREFQTAIFEHYFRYIQNINTKLL